MKEGRNRRTRRKPHDDELQKMPHTKIQAPSETRTRTLALVAGYESRRANHYTTRRPWPRFELRVPRSGSGRMFSPSHRGCATTARGVQRLYLLPPKVRVEQSRKWLAIQPLKRAHVDHCLEEGGIIRRACWPAGWRAR